MPYPIRRIAATAARVAVVLTWIILPPTPASADPLACGLVFDDRDGDGRRGPDEPALPGVGVSNGRDVVVTDEAGRYQLPVDDDEVIFVIKPRNYLTAVDRWNLPRFYYVHKPAGSPKLEFPGVAPTGPLPESIDFPLRAHPEPDTFRVIVLGDPQPRDVQEVNYLAQDVVADLVGVEAAFGVSLGDIVFDDLGVYPPYNAVMSAVGVPWHNVHGNHDMNYDVQSDELADETWERVYGPPTYSFDWGPVHFIAVDDVDYDGDVKRGRYHGEFGRHLKFIENDLAHVPRETLVVLMMHIPVVEARDKEALFALLADRPHTFSLSAHTHQQTHHFIGTDEGWTGAAPHHHLTHATACGSWWQGATDEFGVPHTMMADGAPNGHSIITFSGHEYSIRFHPAHRPADEQMHIFAPHSVAAAEVAACEVLVNVYAGSERSTVEMQVGADRPWVALERVERPDPYLVAIKAAEKSDHPPNGRELPKPDKCPHLWAGKLPADLPKGTHVIRIRTTDMFGQSDSARRIIRVE